MATEKAPWHLTILSYPCPDCGAGPGQNCVTANGNPKTEEHVARARNGARCPKCNTRLGADSLPDDLCDKCALLRSLNVERATVYRRKANP